MRKTIAVWIGMIMLVGGIMAISALNASGTSKSISTEPKFSTEPGPIIGDMLIPDDINRSNRSCLSPPGYYDTSEYMMGDVMVGVILLESNGTIDTSTEDWTSTEKSNVISEIQAGLNWWAAREPNAHLTFTYDINYGVPTSYEPITRPHTDHWLWINEATDYLGYPNDGFTGVRDYLNAIRTANNKDWAFAIFVVDSSADTDGKFADNYFAYAYRGGPCMVMTYKNGGYGISNMDAVTAHEAGHIFYALDEYASAGNSATDRSGYLNIENQNNEGDGSSNVACIMRGQVSPYTNGNICTYTRQMVGWRDTDGDNILDIVDNFPNSSLNVYSPDPTNDNTPTYTGNASEVPYPNNNPYGWGNDVSVNTITNVQYRVDSGSWVSTTASDGIFDEYSENFTFTTSTLLDGTHTIEVRSTNSVGNIETTYASDTITIETTAPTVTAVTPTANETNVSIATTVTKTFSEPMNKTATEAAFNLYSDGSMTPVAGTKSWSGDQLIFTPSTSLSWDTKYWANVSAAAKDLAGDPLASANNTWFRTVARGTAMATGPTGYSTVTGITLTYSWTGTPTSVKLYYSKNGNVTWNLVGSDSSIDGSYTYTITSGDGTYGWIAVAVGGGSAETDPPVSGTTAETYPLILDTVPPNISITGVVDDAYHNVSVTPLIEITDINLNTTLITLNGELFISGSTIADEGDYVLFVQATDKANNVATKTLLFTIDKTSPTITVTGVTDASFYNTSVTPIIEITDANLNITTMTLNSAPFVSGTTITAESFYVLFVEAIDKAGNIATETISFTIDRTPPSVSSTVPVSNTINVLMNQNIVAVFSDSMNTSIVPILTQTNGTVVAYLFLGWSTTNVDNDTAAWDHDNWDWYDNVTLEVSGYKDKAGNVGSTYIWSFRTAPRATAAVIGPTGYNNVTSIIITYSWVGTPDNVTLYYTLDDGSTWILIDNDASVDGFYDWVVPNDGTYGWYALANGGGSTETPPTSGTAPEAYPFILDTISPTIVVTDVVDGKYYNVSVTPTIEITDPNLNITNITLNGVPFASGTTITEEGDYVLFVQATDKANNTATKTVSFTIDKTKPNVTVTGVVDSVYYNVSLTPVVDFNDTNLNVTTITLNGAPFESGTMIAGEDDYVLVAYVSDKAGNTASKIVSFTIDKTKPEITVTGVADNAYYNTSVTPVVDITDLNLNTASVMLNSEIFINGTTIANEGNYVLYAQATDKANNIATKTISFTIDKTKPEITVTGVADNAYHNTSVTPVVDITDLNLNTTLITLNDEPFISGGTVAEEGDYVLFVQATDKAGNTISKNIYFVIDKTNPNITISNLMDGTYYNISITPMIEFNDTNLNITTITLNSVAFDSGTTITLENGYVLVAHAVDKAGNTASKTVSFTIDKTPPTITITDVTRDAYYNVNVTPVITITDTYLNTTGITLNDNPFVSSTVVSAEDVYYLNVSANDLAGNIATKNIVFTIDKTTPSIIIAEKNQTTTNSSFTIHWLSSETVQYYEVSTDGVNWININASAYSTFTLSKGVNTFYVRGKDLAGNTNTASITIEKLGGKEERVDYLIYLITISIVFAAALIVVIAFLKRKIRIRCPACKTVFDVKPEKRPFKIKCPKCGREGILR